MYFTYKMYLLFGHTVQQQALFSLGHSLPLVLFYGRHTFSGKFTAAYFIFLHFTGDILPQGQFTTAYFLFFPSTRELLSQVAFFVVLKETQLPRETTAAYFLFYYFTGDAPPWGNLQQHCLSVAIFFFFTGDTLPQQNLHPHTFFFVILHEKHFLMEI
jgi:hypothetical protein